MLQQSKQRLNAISFSEAVKDEIPYELRDECECMICSQNYNLQSRVPMNICASQHHCCLICLNKIYITTNECPFCKIILDKKLIHKNRIICKVLQEAAKRKGITFKINQNPEIKEKQRQNNIIQPQNISHLQPLLPSASSNSNNIHRRNQQNHQQTNHIPQIQKFSKRINSRLYHGETPLIFFNVFFLFLFSIIQINYSENYHIEISNECCSSSYYQNCKSINQRIRESCSNDSVFTFWMIGTIFFFYVCKKNWKKYTQTFLLLFLLTYHIMSIRIVYYYVIQKLDFFDLVDEFKKINKSLPICMGFYYVYFEWFIYVSGIWTVLCFFYMFCRFVANE